MKIFLVRHGRIAGDPFATPERPARGYLSAAGIEQAERARAFFADKTIDAAYASPYGRALQTAEIALAGKPDVIHLLPGIEEWLPDRSLEKLPSTEFEAIRRANTDVYAEETWKTPLGEGCYDMFARVAPATLAALKAEGVHMRHGGFAIDAGCEEKSIAFFAHGGSLCVMLAFLLGMKPFPVGNFSFDLCGIAEIIFNHSRDVWYPAIRFRTPGGEETGGK